MISVSTEINDEPLKPSRGWVLFDGECAFCQSWVQRIEPILAPRGFVFVPLQTPWVRSHFRLPEDQLLGEMRVLLRTGESSGGADAIIVLAKYVWWAWPLVALAGVPGVRPTLRGAYRHIASRRYCISGVCAISQPTVANSDRAPQQESEP